MVIDCQEWPHNYVPVYATDFKDQKILYTQANQFIYLLEETEMQELILQLDGTHEDDCKKSGETLTTGQRIITLLFCKQGCGKECIIHITNYQTLNELLFYIEQIDFGFESVPAGIQKLWPSFQSWT